MKTRESKKLMGMRDMGLSSRFTNRKCPDIKFPSGLKFLNSIFMDSHSQGTIFIKFRFKILSMVKSDGKMLANIEIYADEIAK